MSSNNVQQQSTTDEDPILIAQRAERDLNSRGAKVGSNISDTANESGVDAGAAQKFPGGDVRYGSAASGAGDNREIPVQEGGDLLRKAGEKGGVGHPTKARDFEGPGGPETKAEIERTRRPGDDDV
ncbi:MAG: hypothetical protein M4579_002719 [Chaenotheca gracillima]|nr:MAG: hypothetical protein M4579_002719 [Chaenotheca gracillima]